MTNSLRPPNNAAVGSVSSNPITALLQALVRIPSRAVGDDLRPVLRCMQAWFDGQGLAHRELRDAQGQPVALYAEVRGQGAVPDGAAPAWWLLNATLDTAGFGELAQWRHAPTAGVIEDGWLQGRGSADSKAGAALFAHLLQHFAARANRFYGRLGLLLDLHEHSGAFSGARAFFDAPEAPRPQGVIIGYPGMDEVVAGGRGFLRARIQVLGVAAHSGASGERGINAIDKAVRLAQRLSALALPQTLSADFPLPAQLTLTGVQAGDGSFSQVPDACELRIDIRLTPGFDAAAAQALVASAVAADDAQDAPARAARITWLSGWPAYRVPQDHPMVCALQDAALQELGRALPCVVVGPSNIGNYLAGLGVPALCGFGVHGLGIHALDERVELASIAPVWRIYRQALERLLGLADDSGLGAA